MTLYTLDRAPSGALVFKPVEPSGPASDREALALAIVRTLGDEAIERLLLCGRFQFAWDALSGRKPG